MKNQKGFTVIEILATIIIVVLVAVMFVPGSKDAIENAYEKIFGTSMTEIIISDEVDNLQFETDMLEIKILALEKKITELESRK